MVSSVVAAQQAGQLAAQIVALQSGIAAIDAAVTGGASLRSMEAGTTAGALAIDFPLTPTATANILTAVKTELDVILTALTAQLAAIT